MKSILEEVKIESLNKLQLLRVKLQDVYSCSSFSQGICVYTCGSLGRLEATDDSDLDLFFISMNKERNEISNLDTYTFFSDLYAVTKTLKYPAPSKEGMYWSFTSKHDLLDIGSREEDYVNSFTARMLLILESKVLYHDSGYNSLIKEIIEKYFIDYQDNQDDFYPLFLMNDILRYWYTLTLNYEYRRDPSDTANKRYWKRLKLKFSRLITCYSMLACLYEKSITPARVEAYIKMTPFERLHNLAGVVPAISTIMEQIEEEYGWYMNLRINQTPDWWEDSIHKSEALDHADRFHNIVVHDLMGELSLYNPQLYQIGRAHV